MCASHRSETWETFSASAGQDLSCVAVWEAGIAGGSQDAWFAQGFGCDWAGLPAACSLWGAVFKKLEEIDAWKAHCLGWKGADSRTTLASYPQCAPACPCLCPRPKAVGWEKPLAMRGTHRRASNRDYENKAQERGILPLAGPSAGGSSAFYCCGGWGDT